MENNTDVVGNWVLSETLTQIKTHDASGASVLSKVNEEISIKAQEIDKTQGIEIKSFSEVEDKGEIDLQSLPLYLPEPFNVNKNTAALNHTYMTQRWVGHIIEITGEKFKAKLEDLTQPGTVEIGTFDIQDTLDEKEMIKLGAVFYFSVGYEVIRGQSSKQRFFRFQRLSEWTLKDFDHAADRAKKLESNLNWE